MIKPEFLHIRTTELFKDDIKAQNIFQKWSERFNEQKKEYNLNIFNLAEVILWQPEDDNLSNLIFLLEQGRKTNQVVVLMGDEEQFEKLKNTNMKLYETILGNTIDLEKEDVAVCIEITE
ncbi:hypothetical protein [Lysinibacillus sphaericus]|uniref:Uncharacterized protein n=1 Tax=Lysinibacillus sphaericus (strain C3-41) TaxID=444177 RepID=B1I0A6_LYSSC|nr:hypothetical protein [Lysinibacillus sphaericus]MBE5085725.1 hypothetical protein [Bacillus thuringiensis]ACA42265.1 hypothetical protein Bsph_p035 [Lysinibacillus sphaericus C3-41]AMO35408.1 hypothetical protein AR327_23235 [Lysinibacillus sphaericus]AMR93159.1 hypothetical protein A1T07_23420 [Lysinibacillus sphaericus]MBG9710662.1 hypothetical protein [Lysinibacillus sphaericus]